MKNKISEFRTPKEQLLMFILYEEDMQLMVEFKHHCTHECTKCYTSKKTTFHNHTSTVSIVEKMIFILIIFVQHDNL